MIEQVAPTDPDVFGVDAGVADAAAARGRGNGSAGAGTRHDDRPRVHLTLSADRAAIADAAELLISQARAREQLAAERELLTRLLRTDALTGIANRRSSDEHVAEWMAGPAGRQASVISCDVDGLKAANDRYGHDAGDAIIRGRRSVLAPASASRTPWRGSGVTSSPSCLAPDDMNHADRIVARIRRSEKAWRVTEHAIPVRLSVGSARVVEGDIIAALAVADRSMYATKRRRARQGVVGSAIPTDRRRQRPTPRSSSNRPGRP